MSAEVIIKRVLSVCVCGHTCGCRQAFLPPGQHYRHCETWIPLCDTPKLLVSSVDQVNSWESENFEKCCVLDCFLKRSVVLPSFSGSLDDGFCARREGISIVRAHRENGRAAFQRTVGWHERTPVCETRSWVKFTGVHLLRVIPDVAHHGFRLPIDGHWVH